MGTIDFAAVDALTFDCYGTLIDWERGILAALRPVLAADGVGCADEALLERFAVHEARLEAGPYLRYADELVGCLRALGEELAFAPTEAEAAPDLTVPDLRGFADLAAA